MEKKVLSRRVLVVIAMFAVIVLFAKNAKSADLPDVKGDIITVKQLKALIDAKDPNLVIIGALNPAKAIIPLNISGKPIAGSFSVWRGDYSGNGSKLAVSKEVGGVRKSNKEIEELLSKAGATANSKIVVYSADAMHDGARLYWQIKLLGQKYVKYLDGGLNAWKAAGYPTGDFVKLANQKEKSKYKAPKDISSSVEANINDVVKALKNPNEWVVIDTRNAKENNGTESSAGAYGMGRLKGSVFIPWTDAVNEDNTLKSPEELKAIYGKVIAGKKVITYCQSGVRSAHTLLVLKEVLGAKEVYNYDGSWIEWSFVASTYSDGKVNSKLQADVRSLTEKWTDNKKAY